MSDYGLDPAQFLRYVIRPTLQQDLQLWSPQAEVLVLGTALVESRLRWLDQLDKRNLPGPAYGLWETERATHVDLYVNFLVYQPALRARLDQLVTRGAAKAPAIPDVTEVVGNLKYACAVCRLDYYREKGGLPPANDAHAMARYHKRYYNSAKGATDVTESMVHFQRAVELSANT